MKRLLLRLLEWLGLKNPEAPLDKAWRRYKTLTLAQRIDLYKLIRQDLKL